MINCAKLTTSLALASCRTTNPALMGEVVLIAFDDWQKAEVTYDSTDTGVITGIVLDGSTKGVKLTSHEKAFDGSYSMNKGTYANSFVHTLVLRAFDRTQGVKDAIDKIINGRYVAIVHNVDKSDVKTAFEVYGAQNGLLASAVEATSTDTDGVVATITLASDDAQRESKVPASFCAKPSGSYDYSATESAFNALGA